MVRTKLRSLEKKLVFQRTENRVELQVDKLVELWQASASLGAALPDPMDFIGRLFDEGIYLPTYPKAIRYLDECLSRKAAPNPRTLRQTLLPWSRRGL